MKSPRAAVRRDRTPELLPARPPKALFRAIWREGAAVAGGFVVLLATAWLIWAALVEAALALAQAA